MDKDLQINEYLNLATLPDETLVSITKQLYQTNEGQYLIVRRRKNGDELNDVILEDNFITVEAAINRANVYIKNLQEELK